MPENGQTHFNNLAAFAARFLKCVWLFWNIICQRVKIYSAEKIWVNESLFWREPLYHKISWRKWVFLAISIPLFPDICLWKEWQKRKRTSGWSYAWCFIKRQVLMTLYYVTISKRFCYEERSMLSIWSQWTNTVGTLPKQTYIRLGSDVRDVLCTFILVRVVTVSIPANKTCP